MKKIIFNILIFFGCFLLLLTSIGAVLIIAPGMELLGLMYIRSTSGNIDKTEFVSDATGYKSIQINSNNIPVVIEFVQSYSLTVNLVEDYNGFARAGAEPSVDVISTGEDIVIKSHEYKPFLGYSRGETSGLYVKIPMYYTNNIIVNSNKSSVLFSGQRVVLNDITINASGKINFNNNMDMHSLVLNFGNKRAIISDNVNLNGTIYATSKRGSLTTPAGFTGSLNFTSTTGDLICADCGQLTFKSKTGRIKSNGSLPHIMGDAYIETSATVTLGKVDGSLVAYTKNGNITVGAEGETYTNRTEINTSRGSVTMKGTYTNVENNIKTKTGKINVDSATNIKVSSGRGTVTVNNISSSKITTKNGKIRVNNADNTILETGAGLVSVGGENQSVSNLLITTKSGKVVVSEACTGEFNITTTSGSVDFTQKKGEDAKLTIVSKKGAVKLTNITGETNVTTSGKINATLLSLTKPVVLNGKNKAVTVELKRDCLLDLSSKKKIEKAPDMITQEKTFKTVPEEGADAYLKVVTEKGKISVLLNKD